MNPTSLYITLSQIILLADHDNPKTWLELYRLAPYLRNSLCCVVCNNLLVDPQTPAHGQCQHHLCRNCRGGRKKLKPACLFCKDCMMYDENKTLRTLLQCYKKMCIKLINSAIYRHLQEQSELALINGIDQGAGNLITIIREGASFVDNYQINGGLSKAVYSILPCIYTNSAATQTPQVSHHSDINSTQVLNSNSQNVPNGNNLYSVTYAGSGNKITIKRKPKPKEVSKITIVKPPIVKKDNPKKPLPMNKLLMKTRKGCRCGNATAHPGKLTCCGQRCPCYVESKACTDCKCRGCRNPHRADGHKVSHLGMLESYAHSVVVPARNSTIVEPDRPLTLEELRKKLLMANVDVYDVDGIQSGIITHVQIANEDEEINVDV